MLPQEIKMKGLKKAAGEAKRIPEGYHMEGWYNKWTDVIELFDEYLNRNEIKKFDLTDDEVAIMVFPGDTMEKIKARVYEMVEWDEEEF